MSKIKIAGKEYTITINLGVLADLESRGYDLDTVTGAKGFKLQLIIDLLDLAAGVPIDTLRGLPPAALTELAEPVAAAISEAFEIPGGEADGEPDATKEPGELSR